MADPVIGGTRAPSILERAVSADRGGDGGKQLNNAGGSAESPVDSVDLDSFAATRPAPARRPSITDALARPNQGAAAVSQPPQAPEGLRTPRTERDPQQFSPRPRNHGE